MEKVAFILPTRDHNEDLFKCLKSINDTIDKKSQYAEILIVDDHSSKSSREELITNVVKFNIYKNLTINTIFLSKTSGFIKACNIGIKCILNRKITPKYIGILHDDVIVFKNWLTNLLDAFRDISAWAAASMSLSKYDLHYIKNLNIPEIKDLPLNEDSIENVIDTFLDRDKNFDAEKAQAFAMLFRTDAFQKLGLFNEDNLASNDIEYEFCKKIREQEKIVKIVPSACVFHRSRMSAPENPNTLTWQYTKKAVKLIQRIQSEIGAIKKRYVVYTYIREGEAVPMFSRFDDSIEYVCFTSSSLMFRDPALCYPWRFYYVEDFVNFFRFPKNDIKIKEFIKLNPHLFFNSFKVSIWIDPMYSDAKDLDKIAALMNPNDFMLAADSAVFNCSYRRLIDMKNNQYMTPAEFDGILQVYRRIKYPNDNGMIDSSILIRKHNDERCKASMNRIWNFVQHVYPNSELFFNAVLWHLKYDYSYVPVNVLRSTNLTVKGE